MALSRRRSDRFAVSIWPGFVDAMTALLLVLMFVLSIFMIVQFTLRETITGQESQLGQLHDEIARLADTLGMERAKSTDLEQQVGVLDSTLAAARDDLAARERVISTLTDQVGEQQTEIAGARTRISDFEAQVAALLLEREGARKTAAELEAERKELTDSRAALQTALAAARKEVDLQTEEARLAAAKREALEALIADLKAKATASDAALAERDARLGDAEADRLATAAATQALRERLKGADDELSAMTLALEQKRREAEETLTLLAAAQSAEARLNKDLAAAKDAAAAQMSEAEKRAALLAVAEGELAKGKTETAENQRRMALLNANIASLRGHLGSLEGLLDAAEERGRASGVEAEALGARLNSALAQVAREQRARAQAEANRATAETARATAEAERARLEEAERVRLEAEKKQLEAEARDLESYRSEFFGRLRKILGGREGIRIEGDRFVFSSEVLFEPASAQISAEGQTQISRVGSILSEVAAEIPPEIDWIIRVDGHTDDTALSGNGRYRDNWELSQARALAVVRYLTDQLGFPPGRLAANGFGEFQPLSAEDTDEARARNRRIELKLTER